MPTEGWPGHKPLPRMLLGGLGIYHFGGAGGNRRGKNGMERYPWMAYQDQARCTILSYVLGMYVCKVVS